MNKIVISKKIIGTEIRILAELWCDHAWDKNKRKAKRVDEWS